MSVFDNIRANNKERNQLFNKKIKLLDRMEMKMLQELYDKYVYIAVKPKETKADQESIIGGLTSIGNEVQNLATNIPNNRRKLIEAIAKQMSFDSLMSYAKQHKIDTTGIV